MSRLPLGTALLAAVVVLVALVPGAPEALALDRAAPLEAWRWLTGHLAHFSWNQLGWDLAVFAVLAGFLEVRDRARLALVLLASALAVSAAVAWGQPALGSYRGLSGLDAALSAAVAVELWRTSRGAERAVPLAMGGLIVAKVLVELATGRAIFADEQGFVAVPLAHAVGGLVGALGWTAARRPLATFSRCAR